MIEMDYDETVTILSEIVDEFGPETVYEKKGGRCNYVYGDRPDCLVGKVLARVGVPVARLASADRASLSGMSADTLLRMLAEEEVLSVDGESHALLSEVQCRQDQGEAWGDALRQAQRFVTSE